MSDRRSPNRLSGEKSPYLLEHAYNPVDWYPWGEDAFQRAKAEDRPIFLSIGYSSCHWCHRLARESFENEATAALMNEKFVSIKVDREERPDIDEVYMKAVVAMTGHGGWPLSVFLTPGLKPFYGGTYFPPTSRQGLPAFRDVLNFVSDLWTNRREDVTKSSEDLTAYLKEPSALQAGGALSRDVLDAAFLELVSGLDEQYGGFSAAPKFPLPNCLEFLLRYHARKKESSALRAVKKTLESMADGGIHDQLGGGFHRYSTDRFWLVPHFEKMLYDNALLARVYLEAYQLTGEPGLLATARDTLDWILSDMSGNEGGFYSALDADTPDGEGYYYTWTPAEVEEALGTGDAAVFDDLFGVTSQGNFEDGRSIPHVTGSLQSVSSRLARDQKDVLKTLETAKRKLLEARRRRARPTSDDKVLTSWNSLAISAFSYGFTVVGDVRYLQASTRCARFLLENLVVEGRVFRRYRDGDVAIDGFLDDYSFLVTALVDLYETTFDVAWLREALSLSERMVELFWDETGGGFFMNPSDGVIARIKDAYDGPMPSGNSVAAMALLRLSEFTGREDFRERAERTMKAFGHSMESSPSSHACMLSALDFWFGSKEIVITGPVSDESFARLLSEIRRRFLPSKVLALAGDGANELSALTDGKGSLAGKPTVYICDNFACKSPVTEVSGLVDELDG